MVIFVDYITEKLFHTYLDKSNAIYVYRGAPNVKDILPKNTYIDVRDFDSPKALAKFMIELGSNEDKYVSYLKEIDKYRIDEGLSSNIYIGSYIGDFTHIISIPFIEVLSC
jgi:hypothetical protein